MTRLTDRNIEFADEDVIEMCRGMTGDRKRRVASSMFAMARELTLSRVRREHPQWDESQVRSEVFRRLQGGTV